MEKNITRGLVHVIAHDYEGVYHIEEDGNLSINIQQIEAWKEGRVNKKCVKSSIITGNFDQMLFTGYRSNQSLTGNICIVEQTEPVIEDQPEEYLYWNEEKTKVHRDNTGTPIYRYQMYCPNEPYQKTGEVDKLLM
jgi:hypothetical protein